MKFNLNEMLKNYKISQAKLANELQITQSAVNKYVLNKAEPSLENLCKMADYLHVTTDELLGRETNLINIASLDEYSQAIIKQLNSMSDKEKHLILQFIEFLNNKG